MPDKNFTSSPMTKEIDRAGTALDLALAGDFVSLVSGGDPGIYAMAGLVFELARSRNISLGHEPDQITINVIPGVSALSAAASLLGSPINHDFATISLSDRLTPWEVIEKRLSLAAQGDFVIVLYNPKSKGRTWQIGKAFEIIGKHRSPETPVGIARRATRPGESIEITTLERGDQCDIDMQSTVIIGSSKSFIYQGRMVTPRGYSDKYEEALPK